MATPRARQCSVRVAEDILKELNTRESKGFNKSVQPECHFEAGNLGGSSNHLL